jgi:hypothetical protein
LKLIAFTLDLESDYAGYVDNNELFIDIDRIDDLLSKLTSHGIKITAFTVGKLFEQFPDIIRIFEKYNCEFEAHSYSHDFKNPDTESEIEKAKEAYFQYFGKYPSGYRSPRGIITRAGIYSLAKHGFLYDSSVFPSYFPNPIRYLFRNKEIHYYENCGIMEIPFSSISPFRLTLSVSYLKLFGLKFFLQLSKKFPLPDIICFDSHIHDFIVNEKSYRQLSAFWRLVYGRNKYKGTDFCLKYLDHLKQQGYTFCYMSEIYQLNRR